MIASLDDLLALAYQLGASGLVVREHYPPMVILDGESRSLSTPPAVPDGALREYVERLERERNLPLGQPFGIGHSYHDGRLRARLQFSRDADGYTLTARLIEEQIRSLESLGLSSRNLHHIERLRRGLVLICGDVGHGKTTLWRAMVAALVTSRRLRVSTIEDPVEYLFRHLLVQQHEVTAALTYAMFISHWLRSDIQVGVIGEIRDVETARYALQAAESGLLVIATMHAERSVDAPDRLAGFFGATDAPLARTQLSYALSTVFSPRLVPLVAGGRRMLLESFPIVPDARAIIRSGDTKALNDLLQSGGRNTKSDLRAWTIEDALLEHRDEITRETMLTFANDPDRVLMDTP